LGGQAAKKRQPKVLRRRQGLPAAGGACGDQGYGWVSQKGQVEYIVVARIA